MKNISEIAEKTDDEYFGEHIGCNPYDKKLFKSALMKFVILLRGNYVSNEKI